ncbi:hypothetical protein LU604_17190 [Erwinia tracheiphila]|uniref:Lipoprotein n=1 Tax=Erwinia tracheiphila TaxID=65700 RepID=A0A345CNZ3_9GAMM|nr:hypothetical protein [Erwinia tracheiphila]AXF75160.1 hypothetical protein AV903_02005 [Erwinia tracheiphila]UIA82296.1 hypothetical protein LU604_17190 [Erwinia tracheiphila]UIA90892.1 hypothetical protein LU632_16775 [Erwinia tracheiphila]
MKMLLVVLASVWLLSGCATIVGSKTQDVAIKTWPQGVKFVVQDETGRAVAEGVTPKTVTLEKSDGSYFGKKKFTLLLERTGFVPQTIPLSEKANLWYILGNIPLGVFPGWLIVDPFNGGMYNIEPAEVETIMNPVGARS